MFPDHAVHRHPHCQFCYAADHEELANGRARRGLAIVTCIDTRIDPLEAFGLIPGDAKVIRNAGARVTDDVLRTLIIASHALGVNRVALIQHTDCGVANNTQESLDKIVETQTGEVVGDLDFLDDRRPDRHACTPTRRRSATASCSRTAPKSASSSLTCTAESSPPSSERSSPEPRARPRRVSGSTRCAIARKAPRSRRLSSSSTSSTSSRSRSSRTCCSRI